MAEYPLLVSAESHKQLQSVVRRVLNMRGTIEGGKFKNSDDAITFFVPNRSESGNEGTDSGVLISWFKIVKVDPDISYCKRVAGYSADSVTEGIADETFPVYRPPNLRSIGNHGETRNGWLYNYLVGSNPFEGNHRTAVQEGYETELQVIMPVYAVDDFLLATTYPSTSSSTGYKWQDLNIDARLWVTECS